MIGICALCQKNAELQNSHLIPKWAYRRVCDVDAFGAKAPIHIAGGNAILSNRQTTRHLLCADCEQRFSRCENYVAWLTETDNGRIRLLANVTRHDTQRKILASLNENVDVAQIAYFAVSLFWRGCVMTGACKLGPYEQRFRKYLLGTTKYLPEASISMGIFDQSPKVDARGWVSEPASRKTPIGWLHGFLIAGLVFRCWVGKAVPTEWQRVSLVGHNSTNYVPIVKPEECADFLAAAEMAGNAMRRGRLARGAD